MAWPPPVDADPLTPLEVLADGEELLGLGAEQLDRTRAAMIAAPALLPGAGWLTLAFQLAGATVIAVLAVAASGR